MKKLNILLLLLLLLFSCSNNEYKALEAGFDNPPADCRPCVWWHWMGGQVSRDGIKKDLEWMQKAGIGGIHCFDAGFNNVPRLVKERKAYMSEAWKDCFNYAIGLADSLGLEVSIASSPGWSITGGPWVSEDDAQKKLVWSRTKVKGGQSLEIDLPRPPSCAGPYQDELQFPNDPDRYRYYRDICIIAMRAPVNEQARISHSRAKTGFILDYRLSDADFTPEYEGVCPEEDVFELTEKVRDGVLSWNAPEGEWLIFRFGYSLLGRTNGPSVPEATGLEADKLDSDAMRRYYINYLRMYEEATGGRLGSDGIIKNFLIDSYEAGKGTWTPLMVQEFEKRRGYSLKHWMPVLAGEIIGSSERSEQFLFDWRRTLGELLVENHYDLVNEVLADYGMRRFSESHEERRAFVGDGMMTKRGADMPMSAFWVRKRAGWYATYPGCEADLRESASVSHIYGQNICGAESFTTNGKRGKWDGFWAYQCHPGLLKRYADAAMSHGLNRFIIHSSVHQPSDEHVPGLSLGIYGQWFNRHDTWAGEARAWTDYLSRSSFMLSQGRNVADIAYFYGEDTNPTAVHYERRVEIPSGWNYDYVNADILCNVLKIKGKSLKAESGAEYRAVVLDTAVHKMSIDLLRALDRISSAGTLICGNKPLRCADLGNDAEFAELTGRIWSRDNTFLPENLQFALRNRGIDEDVILEDTDSMAFVHRKLRDSEIYWLSNASSRHRTVKASFKVDGLVPEIWNAYDASVKSVEFQRRDGRTVLEFEMDRDDALFVVFTRKGGAEESFRHQPETESIGIDGPWHLAFPDGRGAPDGITLNHTEDLSASESDALKYYSGTIIYSTTFSLESLPELCTLSLGRVCNMARVSVNGHDLGLCWKEPYSCRIDRGILKKGDNTLEIRVINSWANRLIGDAREGSSLAYTAETYYEAEDPLPPSGLIGPVLLKY